MIKKKAAWTTVISAHVERQVEGVYHCRIFDADGQLITYVGLDSVTERGALGETTSKLIQEGWMPKGRWAEVPNGLGRMYRKADAR